MRSWTIIICHTWWQNDHGPWMTMMTMQIWSSYIYIIYHYLHDEWSNHVRLIILASKMWVFFVRHMPCAAFRPSSLKWAGWNLRVCQRICVTNRWMNNMWKKTPASGDGRRIPTDWTWFQRFQACSYDHINRPVHKQGNKEKTMENCYIIKLRFVGTLPFSLDSLLISFVLLSVS